MSAPDESDERQKELDEETSRRVARFTKSLIRRGLEVRDTGEFLDISEGRNRATVRKDSFRPSPSWNANPVPDPVRLPLKLRIAKWAGYGNFDSELCTECGEPVGAGRRAACPDTTWCVYCATSMEDLGCVPYGKMNEWHLTIENLQAPVLSLGKLSLTDLFARDDSGEFAISDPYLLPEVLRAPGAVRFVLLSYAADLSLFVKRVGDRMEFDVDGLTRKFEARSKLNPVALHTNARLIREACTYESGLQCLAVLALNLGYKDTDIDLRRVRAVVFRAFKKEEPAV